MMSCNSKVMLLQAILMISSIFQLELQGYHPFADKLSREVILNDLSDFTNLGLIFTTPPPDLLFPMTDISNYPA